MPCGFSSASWCLSLSSRGGRIRGVQQLHWLIKSSGSIDRIQKLGGPIAFDERPESTVMLESRVLPPYLSVRSSRLGSVFPCS